MFDQLQNAFDARMRLYRSEHKTLGCKITHMIGVPMIAASLPLFLINRNLALKMQSWGWTLQLAGHYIFEHNKPVFLEARDPLTALAALVFVSEHWQLFLSGQSLIESAKQKAPALLPPAR